MYGLLLHAIHTTPRPWLNMSNYPRDKFGQLLDRLKSNNINTIKISEYTSRETHSTAVTFDDGLQSFYDFAYPLLEEKNIKATIFAVAGLVGKNGIWDVMGKTSHLNARALREISDGGHEVGSHSLTHANLVWLSDGELMKELRDSKSILEDILGKQVTSVSFPFGNWNRRVSDAAAAAGYKYATAYRGHRRAWSIQNETAPTIKIIPVLGVYQFDSAEDAVRRILPGVSLSKIRAQMMSHFSKGTPLVKFRKEYCQFPR